ncbi:NUDIX hydrolase [Planctomicrobium sp. SH664]|uniref:NUDIX hydrolase n=1 Tax=Planctomicrobium sp. SH664 TaxID=3448125 RepID=UPI003F5C042B
MSEEMFDVCDEQDRVIGQAPRSVVHARNLLHRAVHIWVWNSRGDLLLQLRSTTKDQYPSCFTSSASGHVDAGETYQEAAVRELREELQLAGELTHISQLAASASTAYEHTALYFLTSDSPPVPDAAEIAELSWLQPALVAEMLFSEPHRFTPPFRELFREWQAARGG